MEYIIFALFGIIVLFFCYREYKKRRVKPQGYCPKCGAALQEINEFCPRCGHRLKEVKPEIKEEIKKTEIEETGTSFFIPQDEAKTQSLCEVENPKLELRVDINSMISEIQIKKFPCLVGRLAGECDVLIEEPAVGRRHAVIDCVNNEFYITDLNSNNGIYINGLKIEGSKKIKIRKNEVLKIGRALITIAE